MINYRTDPRLAHFSLQDSFVTAFTVGTHGATIEAEIVLLTTHPRYERPVGDTPLCWRSGVLEFAGADVVDYVDRHFRWYVESDGGVFYGNIDQFQITDDGWYLDAEFGELTVHGGTLAVTLV